MYVILPYKVQSNVNILCGNIGSGKTTLTEKLAKHYGWHPMYESVAKNPYLKDFYEDMTRSSSQYGSSGFYEDKHWDCVR